MSAWYRDRDGFWAHRPWWKVVINTALRFVQTRTRPARLWVVATVCDLQGDDDPRPPAVRGYTFTRVEHR